MCGWAIFFVVSMALNKSLDKTIPTTVVVIHRLFFALMALLPTLLLNKKNIFKTKIFHFHAIRSIFTAIAIGCTYYSYRYLPLAVATSIGLSGPLFTSFFALLFLKEKFSKLKVLLIFFGYLGVLIVILPHCNDWSSLSTFAIGVALLGNITMAISIVVLKKISGEDFTQTILFYNTFLTLLIYIFFSFDSFYIPFDNNFYFLIGIGVMGLSLQFCYAKAMFYEQASFVSPLEYLRVLLSIPVGYFIFNESIFLNTILGSLFIMASTYFLVVKER